MSLQELPSITLFTDIFFTPTSRLSSRLKPSSTREWSWTIVLTENLLLQLVMPSSYIILASRSSVCSFLSFLSFVVRSSLCFNCPSTIYSCSSQAQALGSVTHRCKSLGSAYAERRLSVRVLACLFIVSGSRVLPV